jgi:hypothetical protein
MARVVERKHLALEQSEIGARFRDAVRAGAAGREARAGDAEFFGGVRIKRTLRERLLSWPWRPWQTYRYKYAWRQTYRYKYAWTDAELAKMKPRAPQPINRIGA